MSDIVLTSSVDTSVLEKTIPQIVAFGRRTLREQCVTSAAFICLDAQANTTAVAVGVIDSELQVEVTGYTAKGRRSKAKNPAERRVTTVAGSRVPVAVLIVMARTDPNSGYSRATGNRWPLGIGMLPTGPGTAAARRAIIAGWISRMTLSRHSSAHFLQHGWAPAIRTLLSDPAYYAGRSKFRIRAQAKINPMNIMDSSALGSAVIDVAGDDCVVTSENAIGEGGNAVLDEKHRAALIREGNPPLQSAIDNESATMFSRIQKYLDDGLKQDFRQLTA